MILSNIELFKALDEGRLIIRPEPIPRLPTVGQAHSPYDTHSIDLSLGDEITVPKKGQITYDVTKPGKIADTIQQHSETVKITEFQPFCLEPNCFVLGKTLEWIELPILRDHASCLAARIEGKSSRARFGILIHFTAPTVHPGFQGTLTLEMINLGPASFNLCPGMAIAQLIVEEVKGCPIENPSQFQRQRNPAG
jgi:dCTP deaminase